MSLARLDRELWPLNSDITYDYFEYDNEFSLKDFYRNLTDSELAKWFSLDIDGKDFKLLASCNYALSPNQLKQAFKAKKVIVNPADYNSISAKENNNNIIIDYNLTLGNKKIVIKSNSNNLYFRIDVLELIDKIGAKILNLETYPIYKAKVSFVSPTTMRDDYVKVAHPFFGVSLENTNFIRPKLLASLEWICNRYSKCTVLIGDSIHRITIQNNEGQDELNARKKAILLGKKFLRDEHHLFKKFGEKCRFDFVFCSEIQESKEYKLYHENLKNLFIRDVYFKNSVISFSKNYYEKRKSKILQDKWNQLIKSSCEYFLEEFAIFACLKNLGIDGMIYPGSFSTLSEIAAGEHPNALKELKELVVISLHIKKR